MGNGCTAVGRRYVPIDVLEKVIGCGVAAVVDERGVQGVTCIAVVVSYLGEEGPELNGRG